MRRKKREDHISHRSEKAEEEQKARPSSGIQREDYLGATESAVQRVCAPALAGFSESGDVAGIADGCSGHRFAAEEVGGNGDGHARWTKSLEATLRGGHYSVSRQLELVNAEQIRISEPTEQVEAARTARDRFRNRSIGNRPHGLSSRGEGETHPKGRGKKPVPTSIRALLQAEGRRERKGERKRQMGKETKGRPMKREAEADGTRDGFKASREVGCHANWESSFPSSVLL